MDDFCITHGYEHMTRQFGNPIPFCAECEREREPPQQWFVCEECHGAGEFAPNYDDSWNPCSKCGGEGGKLDDVEPDQPSSQ